MAKRVLTRVQHKHDTEANWANATFSPLAGELIIYDADDKHPLPRFKVGDGETPINNLNFVDDDLISKIQNELDNSISCGQADPSASTTSKFYFKYSNN